MNETREQIISEITALKMLLNDTDYQVTKYAEGLTACTTQREQEAYREAFMAQYGEVIQNRIAWRAKINELEEELDNLPDDEPEEEETEPVPVEIEEDEDEDESLAPEIVHEEGEEAGEAAEPEIVHDDEEEESTQDPEPEAEPEENP